MKDKLRIVVIATSAMFLLMLSYEAFKEFIFKGTLTPWQSHWITIVFSTLVSLVVVLFVVNRLLTMERQSVAIKLKEEKIKSIKQVMRVVHHHVNNLANNLYLVELEIDQEKTVSKETLDALDGAIRETSATMKHLGDMDDPYDDEIFKIETACSFPR